MLFYFSVHFYIHWHFKINTVVAHTEKYHASVIPKHCSDTQPIAIFLIRAHGLLFDSSPQSSDCDQLTCQNISQRVCGYVCVSLSEVMAAKMELAPLRPWDDFFPGTDRFAKPEFGDLTKWNNRVISNLLYYQTNYFAVAVVVFLIVGWVLSAG